MKQHHGSYGNSYTNRIALTIMQSSNQDLKFEEKKKIARQNKTNGNKILCNTFITYNMPYQ